MITAASSSSFWPGLIIWWVFLLLAYWVPTGVAVARRIDGLGQVIVVNLFLGWTVIGWVVALVMAFRHVPAQEPGS